MIYVLQVDKEYPKKFEDKQNFEEALNLRIKSLESLKLQGIEGRITITIENE